MRSGNPTLNAFDRLNVPTWDQLGNSPNANPITGAGSSTMTVGGTVVKTGILLAICSIVAVLVYSAVGNGNAMVRLAGMGGALGGLVLGLIISFKPTTAPFLAPVYAACQGAFLGVISYFFAAKVGGPAIIFQALLLTFGIMAAMLISYASGLLRPGKTFMGIVLAGSLGIGLVYLAGMIGSLVGVNIPFVHEAIHGSGMLGIGFSVFAVIMASMVLALDFQVVHTGVEGKAPKYMEWYGGFALLASLVWLYIELLRLLAKLRSQE